MNTAHAHLSPVLWARQMSTMPAASARGVATAWIHPRIAGFGRPCTSSRILRSIRSGATPSILAARASPFAMASFARSSAFLLMFSALLRAFTRTMSAFA